MPPHYLLGVMKIYPRLNEPAASDFGKSLRGSPATRPTWLTDRSASCSPGSCSATISTPEPPPRLDHNPGLPTRPSIRLGAR